MSEGMREAVAEALAGRPRPDPRDRAAAALALHYGELIDAPKPAGRYRKPLEVLARKVAGMTLVEDDPGEALQVITQALAEQTVASDLGPKLLATLAGLGLTTVSRGEQREGGKSAPSIDPLTKLKEERRLRLANRDAG